ncbi:unannotated protein [freshwater metagenome]|uniref:Unannotated protein n=1 Tax=freshwater metagenome TaxID=449393 RepID=A0A6J7EHB2_9ZZZZ|nr:hypothetical protein [Actinomycetota bacterium]
MVLFVVFIVAPIAELFVFVQVSNAIGFANSLGLIVALALVGAWVVKREGIKVWRRFTEQVQAGQVPSREIADGVLLLAAGALMLAPGFITDAVGLLLLFPPTRAVARGWLMKRQGLGGGRRGGGRVIRATYGGPMTNATDVTDVTEVRGELEQ